MALVGLTSCRVGTPKCRPPDLPRPLQSWTNYLVIKMMMIEEVIMVVMIGFPVVVLFPVTSRAAFEPFMKKL